MQVHNFRLSHERAFHSWCLKFKKREIKFVFVAFCLCMCVSVYIICNICGWLQYSLYNYMNVCRFFPSTSLIGRLTAFQTYIVVICFIPNNHICDSSTPPITRIHADADRYCWFEEDTIWNGLWRINNRIIKLKNCSSRHGIYILVLMIACLIMCTEHAVIWPLIRGKKFNGRRNSRFKKLKRSTTKKKSKTMDDCENRNIQAKNMWLNKMHINLFEARSVAWIAMSYSVIWLMKSTKERLQKKLKEKSSKIFAGYTVHGYTRLSIDNSLVRSNKLA